MGKQQAEFGSSWEAQRAWDKTVLDAGMGVFRWERLMGLGALEGTTIESVRIRTPRTEGGEFLIVVKASVEGKRAVGFHSSTSLPEALSGAANRVLNRTLRWREDRWAEEE
jgi:hypothetical protein